MKPILIAMLGTIAVPGRGDFDQLILDGAGVPRAAALVLDVAGGADLPDPTSVAGVVLTGAAAMVTERAPWSERTAAWLADVVAARTPLLGICYGHQLLAHAFGGTVAANPRGREMGTTTVELTDEGAADPLFAGLPRALRVQETHLQSVLALPPSARLLGGNPADPHQSFAIGARAWGVQFHPEFDAAVIRGYVSERAALLRAEGLDPDALVTGAEDSPHGSLLLRRFVDLVRADGAGDDG